MSDPVRNLIPDQRPTQDVFYGKLPICSYLIRIIRLLLVIFTKVGRNLGISVAMTRLFTIISTRLIAQPPLGYRMPVSQRWLAAAGVASPPAGRDNWVSWRSKTEVAARATEHSVSSPQICIICVKSSDFTATADVSAGPPDCLNPQSGAYVTLPADGAVRRPVLAA